MQEHKQARRLRGLRLLHTKRICKKGIKMKTKYKLSELVDFFERYGRANRKDKRKLADEFGLGIVAASRIAGYLGISSARHSVDKAAISRMLASGSSVKEISEAVHVSKGTVYRQIKSHGRIKAG